MGGFAAHHIRRLVVPVLLPRRAASAASHEVHEECGATKCGFAVITTVTMKI